jgi:hypothetical protein
MHKESSINLSCAWQLINRNERLTKQPRASRPGRRQQIFGLPDLDDGVEDDFRELELPLQSSPHCGRGLTLATVPGGAPAGGWLQSCAVCGQWEWNRAVMRMGAGELRPWRRCDRRRGRGPPPATAAARPLPPPPHAPATAPCHHRLTLIATVATSEPRARGEGGDRTRAGPVRLAYQPPASSTFLSQQTSHQYFSLKTNQHQPPAKRTG